MKANTDTKRNAIVRNNIDERMLARVVAAADIVMRTLGGRRYRNTNHHNKEKIYPRPQMTQEVPPHDPEGWRGEGARRCPPVEKEPPPPRNMCSTVAAANIGPFHPPSTSQPSIKWQRGFGLGARAREPPSERHTWVSPAIGAIHRRGRYDR